MRSFLLATLAALLLGACREGAQGGVQPGPATGPSAADSGTPGATGGQLGGGMMGGGCPMCGWGMGQGIEQTIPQSLPKPQSDEWVGGLREVLGLERLSRNQYEQDARTYSAQMPYGMIIPQEIDHIASIERLFSAYGLEPGTQVPAIRKTSSLEEAYSVCVELEAGLIPRYERAIKAASDQTTRNVLGNLLAQTRMHHAMFQHALSMTGMGMGRWPPRWRELLSIALPGPFAPERPCLPFGA